MDRSERVATQAVAAERVTAERVTTQTVAAERMATERVTTTDAAAEHEISLPNDPRPHIFGACGCLTLRLGRYARSRAESPDWPLQEEEMS